MNHGFEAEPERRPYAAAANVLGVLGRLRSRNLPASVNNDFLRIAGIGEAVFGRVNEALQFLGLVAPDGTPTERLRVIAAAPDAEYRQQLAACLREAYAADFAAVNPEQDSQQQVIDAFRRYEPRSQTTRMVWLFLGLCREAGMTVLDAPRERHMQAAASRRPSARPTPGAGRPARAVETRGGTAAPEIDRNFLFGVTEADLGKLSEQEFDEVWAALGRVAKTVTRARARPTPEPSPGDGEDAGEVNPK